MGGGSLKSQPPLITVMHPMFVDLHSKKLGGGGGGGHYSLRVDGEFWGTLFTGAFCPRGTLFTSELCLPVNNVRGGHFVGGTAYTMTMSLPL